MFKENALKYLVSTSPTIGFLKQNRNSENFSLYEYI